MKKSFTTSAVLTCCLFSTVTMAAVQKKQMAKEGSDSELTHVVTMFAEIDVAIELAAKAGELQRATALAEMGDQVELMLKPIDNHDCKVLIIYNDTGGVQGLIIWIGGSTAVFTLEENEEGWFDVLSWTGKMNWIDVLILIEEMKTFEKEEWL